MPVPNAKNKNQKSKMFTYLKILIFSLPCHVIFFAWTFNLDRHLLSQRQALKSEKNDFFIFECLSLTNKMMVKNKCPCKKNYMAR